MESFVTRFPTTSLSGPWTGMVAGTSTNVTLTLRRFPWGHPPDLSLEPLGGLPMVGGP
ncbi:MAG: hypothetical protein JWM47_4280 [Acidimicrobiales bacterium]|jgi:hypothetical protein|nr:hypothetical protein [Acidimicrobiales bacterium]